MVDADGTLLERSPMFMENLSYINLNTAADKQLASTIVDKLDPDEEVYTACVLGLKDYMAKNHFTGVTLACRWHRLSPGAAWRRTPAAAATCMASPCRACIHLMAPRTMPADLAENLGAHYDIQPIEPLFTAYQHQLHLDGVAAENLQARIRGVIVMAYSNSKGLLAVATGNKSELACGYSTIYGDAVGGYAPIKDLLKTRVWELSRWRNRAAAEGMGIGGLKIVGNEQGDAGVP